MLTPSSIILASQARELLEDRAAVQRLAIEPIVDREPHQLLCRLGRRGRAVVVPGDLEQGATGNQHRVGERPGDRKSTRLNSSHVAISYAVFCLKKKKTKSRNPKNKKKKNNKRKKIN